MSRDARAIRLAPVRAAVPAFVALALIASGARVPGQETHPSPEFVYRIPPEGISLEALAHDAEVATGRTFILSEKSPLRGKTIRLFGEARVASDQVLTLFQSLFVTQGFALKPLGDLGNRILIVDSIDTAVDLKQRALFVTPADLDSYRYEVGTVVMTFFPLRYIRVQNVRAALSQLLTSKSVEVALDVEAANSLLVFGFAPTVYAIKQVISVMDVPQPEANLRFELIGFRHAVAEEVEPIIRNLIEANPSAQPKGGQPNASGLERPAPRLVTDPRLNSLAVYAIEADLIEIRRIVTILDEEVSQPAHDIHIVRLNHTSAEDLADVLMQSLDLSGSRRGGGSRQGRGGGSDRSGSTSGARQSGPASPGGGSSDQNVMIVAEPHTNCLLIRASKSRFQTIKPLIDRLDRRRPQVVIQGAVAELTDDQLKTVGAEIAALQGGSGDYHFGALTGFGLSTLGIVSQGSLTGTGPGSGTGTGGGMGGPGSHLPTGSKNNLLRLPTFPGNPLDNRGGTFGLFTDTLNIPLLISLLQNGTNGNLLSTPVVVANDNATSMIESGRLIPTVGFTAGTGTTPGQASPDTTAFSGYQEAKVSLKISPHISNDDYVRLDIELLVERFIELSNTALTTSGTDSRGTDSRGTDSRATAGSTPPDKTSRKLVGSVTVRNGTTVLIGGLILDRDRNARACVPPFGDAPLVGPLFGVDSNTRERASVYFFLTPTIVSTFDTLDEFSYARKLEILKLQGPIMLIDPDFRPILLDDRWTGIEWIEASGNLDMPRYEAMVPLQECGPGVKPAQDAPEGPR